MSRWGFSANSDWRQLRNPSAWNWLDFRLIGLDVEWDRSLGQVSVDAALLGFRASVSFTYNADTPLRKDLKDRLAEVLSESSVILSAKEYNALRDGMEKAP